MKRTVLTIGIIVLFLLTSVPSSFSITNNFISEYYYSTDEIVWWNTTELSTEPYTAPFFEVYKLKDLGQAAYGLDVADFNNDSRLDFVVSWSSHPWKWLSGISIFYKNSDRSFSIEHVKYYDREIEDVDTVDLDDDGDIDIMVCLDDRSLEEYDASVNILWNDEGNFERSEVVATFNKSEGNWINVHIATEDFNMDGDVDFITGGNCGKVKLFLNDGANSFSDEGVIFDYGDVSWGVATGDFNGDGYPDFVVSADTNSQEYPFNDAGHIYLKLNDKTRNCFDNTTPGLHIASVPFPGDYTIGAVPSGSVEVLDYNNDGLHDVVFCGYYKIYLLIQQSDSSFKAFYAVGLRGRELNWSDYLKEGGFSVGDFNYDGWDDIIAGGVQGDVRILINNHTFVNIVKPEDRLLYFFGNDDYSLKFPGRKVIVGDIEVIAEELEPLSRVDFYLKDELILSDDSEPFVWNWTKFGFGKYKVSAEAFDLDGLFVGRDTFEIWKFL